MTTRRRLLLFGLLAGVTVAILLAGAMRLLSPSRAITRENYAKIHKGMPRDEVEALLGAPDQIADEPLFNRWFKVATRQPAQWAVGDLQLPGPDAPNGRTASWYSLEIRIIIDFDDNDCVCGLQYLFAFDPRK
jgi:outer membrane protein assembly factor BamE (lipoprotein component of BamABCDE complex)